MAETFLNPVIESLIQLSKDEIKSLKGVRNEVQSLKKELEIIQSLLKDADARIDRGDLISDAVVTWMKQLREEADRIEDVVDEYRRHVTEGISDQHGVIGFFCKIGSRIKGLKSCHSISSHIQDINQSLRRIKDMGQGFGLGQSLHGVQGSSSKTLCIEKHATRLGSHFVVEDDGYVDVPFVQDQLRSSLVEGVSARMVISLVGQGGIGKTTLVKKVYDEVKHKFDCHAWITVSQSYDMNILLRNMMKQIGLIVECTTLDYDMMIQELIALLRQHLQIKRYAIIFDEVWDIDFWELMKHVLPSNNNGSRVIITTRNEVVAPCDVMQKLEAWSPVMAYELFCKKTFRHEFCRCPEELEKLSHEIVQKCEGLPLAIGAIAGLLSRKRKTPSEWQKVLDNINLEFKTNPQLTRIFKIISLSYHDLPYHLKPCLLYFGIFPEDFLIWNRRIYQLWISEGFVQVMEGKSLDEEVEGYLKELVERSLVSIEIVNGILKYCKVHDLMHEFIVSKVNNLCFCQILSETNSKFKENKHRRLSVHGSMPKSVAKTIQHYTTIRSILLLNFNDKDQLILKRSFLMALFQHLKLLKVLDFEDTPLDYLPKEVGNLFHLRYLNLSSTNIQVLPKSIGKLHNLQYLNLMHTIVNKLPKSISKLHNLRTLNLLFTFVRELPREINKLRNLRHIFAQSKDELGSGLGVKIQEGFGYLESLQILQNVEVHEDVVGFTKDIENLCNLKSLGVTNLTMETSRAICVVAKKLNHLQDLALSIGDVYEILDLEPISSSTLLPSLLSFCLCGRLNRLPHWFSELTNLEVLVLNFSKLTGNPLEYLKDLPNLTCLRLVSNSYEGEQLHFEEGSFPKLNELYLAHLPKLKLIKMERGTLPLLKELVIQSCPLLEEVPCGIQSLTKLKKLGLRNMPNEFVVRVQPNGETDYFKIQHLPIVDIDKVM